MPIFTVFLKSSAGFILKILRTGLLIAVLFSAVIYFTSRELFYSIYSFNFLYRTVLVNYYPAEKLITLEKKSDCPNYKFNKSFEVKILYDYAKVWGFLKYFAPNARISWDQEAIQFINSLNNINDKNSFNQYISLLLLKTGINKNKAVNVLQKDTCLFADTLLNTENLGLLQKLRDNFKASLSSYAGYNIFTGAPLFYKDNAYYDSHEYPSREYRLLGLFRYWNIINYFYPYKSLTGENWDDLLSEFIPLVANSRNKEEYHLTMLQLAARLRDGHSFVNSETLAEYFGKNYPAFETEIIDDKVVISKQYLINKYGVKRSDIILEVNSESIAKRLAKLKKYSIGSHKKAREKDLLRLVFASDEKSLAIKVSRNGKELILSEKTYDGSVLAGFSDNESLRLLDNNIAYINLSALKSNEIKSTFSMIKACRGVILDLRGYPEFTMFELLPFFLDKRSEFAEIIIPNLAYPGTFYKEIALIGGKKRDYYKGKVIALVNEHTQSRGEYYLMALQTIPGIIVAGRTTAGADGDITEAYLPGKIKMYFSGLGIQYPGGMQTQRTGIVPDRIISYSIDELAATEDIMLEKAKKLLEP